MSRNGRGEAEPWAKVEGRAGSLCGSAGRSQPLFI